ncbi:MAG: DUF3298 domain-containing protein [Bacillota bacterium]
MNEFALPLQIVSRRMVLPNLEIFFPQIIFGTNQSALQSMNRQITDLVQRLIREQGYFQDPMRTQVNGFFELKNNQRGVLSLVIGNYTYPYHAAHGLTILKSLTFDIATGRNYQLRELFKPNADYQRRLDTIIKRQIREREIPIINGFVGVKPDQDYYIADKALVIYYQLYAMTPYVFGFPMFPISVYEIRDIIREDGPLGVMLINR